METKHSVENYWKEGALEHKFGPPSLREALQFITTNTRIRKKFRIFLVVLESFG